MKYIDYDAIVSLQMVLPRLFGELFVGLSHMTAELDIRFFEHSIEVLVKAIE